jgi:hypothetical protein
MTPLDLSLSQQMRVRRQYGSRAYDEATKEFRVEVGADDATPKALLVLVRALVADAVVA